MVKNNIKTDKYTKRRFIALVIITLAILFSYLYGYFTISNSPYIQDNTATGATYVKGENAIQALGKLAVRERASRDGYSRDEFGEGWATKDGCDTRNLILQRDLQEDKLGKDNCIVGEGELQQDPYTGKSITFVRGAKTSSAVQIDHIVALSDAWQKGAQEISYQERLLLANDPLNLLAVDGPTNVEKGDKDAASWLPPNSAYRCMYVARQIAVKAKYKLWITNAEYGAMKRTLSNCPDQVLPIVNSSLNQ